jgi:glycine/D-amino acid oxidase-like deaminating enzyme
MAGKVVAIEKSGRYVLDVQAGDSTQQVSAETVINAAGPFVADVAAMLGVELPVTNLFQQKLAFEDTIGAIPRDMPFSIDLDERILNWTDDERDALAEDPELAWLTGPIAGGTHCRPDGGPHGKWVKLGWAYNSVPSEPQQDLANEPCLDPQFAEIVIRGATALNPALAHYIESPPARRAHYGGYYTMTGENWPLIGPLGPDGAFVIGALSGFGSMAACQAGRMCAAWACGADLPDYAEDLSLARLQKPELLSELRKIAKSSIL